MMHYEQFGMAMAQERVKDMVRAAERERRFTEAFGDNQVGRFAEIRRQVGTAMVRAGERIQGSRARVAEQPQPYGSEVRLAR